MTVEHDCGRFSMGDGRRMMAWIDAAAKSPNTQPGLCDGHAFSPATAGE